MAGLCEQLWPPSESVWGTFRLAWFCAATAICNIIQLPDGPLILNPGSVGCPSYDDSGNDPHVSEAGSPHARYAVLTIDEHQVSADMIAIAYDWKAAAARAEENGPLLRTSPHTSSNLDGTRTTEKVSIGLNTTVVP